MTEPITPASPAPEARALRYEATCAECKTTARGTFEDINAAGWILISAAQLGRVDGPGSWFCPGCTMGLKPVTD